MRRGAIGTPVHDQRVISHQSSVVTPLKTLNIIGSGRVGRACGRMWARAKVFEIQDVLTRSRASAAEAVRFIGAGNAVSHLGEMRCADVWMIATRDDAIV